MYLCSYCFDRYKDPKGRRRIRETWFKCVLGQSCSYPVRHFRGEGPTSPNSNCLRNFHWKIVVFPEMTLVKQKIGGGDRLVDSLHVWMDLPTRDGVDRTRLQTHGN